MLKILPDMVCHAKGGSAEGAVAFSIKSEDGRGGKARGEEVGTRDGRSLVSVV